MLKTKSKKVLIISIISAVVLLVVALFFAYKHFELKLMLSKMDIGNKESVIKVLNLAKNDCDILDNIATKYFETNDVTHGIAVAMHNVITNNSDVCKSLLINYYRSAGADESFLSQFENIQKINTDFKPLTEYDGVYYGGVDGVYCSDFDGLINYKLSGLRTQYMTAAENGVYVLDIADGCKKLILRDCYTVQTVADDTIQFSN